MPWYTVDLILFEQEGDAAGIFGHHFRFAFHHLRHINRQVIEIDAMRFERMRGVMIMFGRIKQSF